MLVSFVCASNFLVVLLLLSPFIFFLLLFMMANHCVCARSTDSNLVGFIGVFRFADKKRNGLAFCAWVLIVPVKRPDGTAAAVRSCVTPISNWESRLKIIRLQSIIIVLLLLQTRVSLHTFLLLSDVSTATPSHYVTALAPKFQNKSTSKKKKKPSGVTVVCVCVHTSRGRLPR